MISASQFTFPSLSFSICKPKLITTALVLRKIMFIYNDEKQQTDLDPNPDSPMHH